MKLIALLLLVSIRLWASESESEALARRYKEIKGDILTHEEEKRKVLADLFSVTMAMKKLNKRRELLMNEKHFVESRIRVASTALQDLKSDLDDQRGKLRGRMRALYKFNGQSTMRLIFSSQTPSDLDRNLKVLKILADKDYVLIRAYEKNLGRYSRETAKLEGHKRRLVAIENEIKSHEATLVSQQSEKNRIVEGIDKETLAQLIKLERIRAESSKIERAMGDSSLSISQSFFERKGKLLRPVTGAIAQGFGLIEDSRYGIKLRSKGVFIEAPSGSEVRSVFGGDVLFSDEVPGFGKTLVLHHGDRYYTVYGNNAELHVRRGQRVGTGDVIAQAGGTWRHIGSGSYFEIRHFSDFVDPEEWFESREGQL